MEQQSERSAVAGLNEADHVAHHLPFPVVAGLEGWPVSVTRAPVDDDVMQEMPVVIVERADDR